MLDDLQLVDHVSYALQLAVGIVFLVAAISKLWAPTAFVRTIVDYDIVDATAARAGGVLIIVVESFLAMAILTGWFMVVALPLGAMTVVVFAAAVGINLRRGRHVPCGCFGGEREIISTRSLGRLAVMLVGLALLSASVASRGLPVTLSHLADEGVGAVGYVLEILTIVAFLMLTATWSLHFSELKAVVRNRQGSNRGAAGKPSEAQ